MHTTESFVLDVKMKNETMVDDDNHQPINTTLQITMCVLVVFVYTCGVFINTKIIAVSKKEKSATWMIDILNSSMLMIHYAHIILMYGITYLVKDLYLYTGSWFCYVSKAMTVYGNTYVTGMSLMIAGLKYAIIVWYEKVRYLGEDKVKKFFFYLSIVYPFYILAAFHLVRPDFLSAFKGFSHSNRCFGESDLNTMTDKDKSSNEFFSLFKMCEFDVPKTHMHLEYIIYLGRKTICWFHLLLGFCNGWNFSECLIYCWIFSFMRR